MDSSNKSSNLKFLCSYGGRILPRPSDRQLRYVGGHTRVLSLPRSVSYSDLIAKLCEMCGYLAEFRCQLPSEEMDVLISVKSDEDLRHIITEYDRASLISGKELKIKAILRTNQTRSSNSSQSSSSSSSCADLSPTNCYRAHSISPPSPIGYLSNSRSRFSKARQSNGVDWNPRQFQPCRHVQAQYMPSLHSNYRHH